MKSKKEKRSILIFLNKFEGLTSKVINIGVY